MHVVSSTDDEFFPHYCAMLHSAWLFNPTIKYSLIDVGISADNLALLSDFTRDRNIDFTIFSGKERLFRDWPSYATPSLYARFLIPELLASDIDRAVFLDADITINGDISELFTIDLGTKIVGACRDTILSNTLETRIQGINFNGDYFNAGVMVMNLPRWRAARVTDNVLDFIIKNPDRLIMKDQSAINVVTFGEVKLIDAKWNFFNFGTLEYIPDIRIIHHASIQARPWLSPLGPFSALYRFHRNQTPLPIDNPPWKNVVDWLKRKIKRKRREICAAFGLKYYKMSIKSYVMEDRYKTEVAKPAIKKAEERLALNSRSAMGCDAFISDNVIQKRSAGTQCITMREYSPE